MKRVKGWPACLILGALVLCTGCVDVVVSLAPWFAVEESEVARFDERLVGSWCEEGDTCEADEAMHWKPGPGGSFNVFGGERLRYRVWLGEIEGIRYLDWWFLCEPSRGVEGDECLELDFPLGSHIAARVERMDDDVLEFRILEGEKLEQLLDTEQEPLQYARTSETLLVLEESAKLQELLASHGDEIDLWTEDTIRLTRRAE